MEHTECHKRNILTQKIEGQDHEVIVSVCVCVCVCAFIDTVVLFSCAVQILVSRRYKVPDDMFEKLVFLHHIPYSSRLFRHGCV